MLRVSSGLKALLLAALALSALLLVACGGESTPASTPTPVPTPVPTATPLPSPTPPPSPEPSPRPTFTPWPERPVRLPQDEGIHNAPLEWWYFNGHVATESGRQFSFHFVTFQTVLAGDFTPRLAHLSWTDHQRGVHLLAEQPDFPVLETSEGEFDLRLGDWRMSGDGERYLLSFGVEEYEVELEAESRKPPVLHHGTGLVDLGVAGKTYYYSRTNLDTGGRVSVEGETESVAGVTWFDHQWGNFTIEPIGWNWLSLNLEDGSDIMVSMAWDQEDRSHISTYGTFVPLDSPAFRLFSEDIVWEPTGTWTSPETGGVYPMGWELQVHSLDLDLRLSPVIEEAEFNISTLLPVIYWEGAVAASGTRNGVGVEGKGFVEMVGYVPSDLSGLTTPPALPEP